MRIPEATIDEVLLIIGNHLRELPEEERNHLSDTALFGCPFEERLGHYLKCPSASVLGQLTILDKSWLLERLPPSITPTVKYKAVATIWSSFAPKSSTLAIFGKNADFAVFWDKFREKSKSLPGSWKIPPQVCQQFPWLLSTDVTAEQARLNAARIERAQNAFAGIRRTIWLGMEQLAIRDRNDRRIMHSAKIDGHEFLIVFDGQFRGVIFDPPPGYLDNHKAVEDAKTNNPTLSGKSIEKQFLEIAKLLPLLIFIIAVVGLLMLIFSSGMGIVIVIVIIVLIIAR